MTTIRKEIIGKPTVFLSLTTERLAMLTELERMPESDINCDDITE